MFLTTKVLFLIAVSPWFWVTSLWCFLWMWNFHPLILVWYKTKLFMYFEFLSRLMLHMRLCRNARCFVFSRVFFELLDACCFTIMVILTYFFLLKFLSEMLKYFPVTIHFTMSRWTGFLLIVVVFLVNIFDIFVFSVLSGMISFLVVVFRDLSSRLLSFFPGHFKVVPWLIIIMGTFFKKGDEGRRRSLGITVWILKGVVSIVRVVVETSRKRVLIRREIIGSSVRDVCRRRWQWGCVFVKNSHGITTVRNEIRSLSSKWQPLIAIYSVWKWMPKVGI